MPVKSEIMLCSQIDNGSPWGDTIFPPDLLVEDDTFADMRFLDYAINDETFNNFNNDNLDFTDLLSSTPASPKYQIRYHDCMWSGTCVDESHPSKKKGMCHRIQPCTSTTASTSSQQNQNDTTSLGTMQRATVECVNSRFMATKAIMTPNLMKSITPVTNSQSVLSRVNTNTALLRTNNRDVKNCIDKHDFDSIIGSSSLRPDTPHSLGDDVSDYKHNIDLTPCPSGNRMKFSDQHSHKTINLIRAHLEDSNDNLSCVNLFQNQKASASDVNDFLNDITFLSDYEEAGDESSGVDLDEEMTDESSCNKTSYNKKHLQASTSTMTRTTSQFEFISDHSYTRKGSKEDFSSLGLETPSDSGEFSFFPHYLYEKYFLKLIIFVITISSDIIAQAKKRLI